MENLSYHSQIRQLRILAEAALTHYDIGKAHLALLAQQNNTTFRVTVVPRPADLVSGAREHVGETRYVLRLCNPRGPSIEELQSELTWLVALRQEAGLGVPEPVCTRAGSSVTEISVEDIPEARRAVLFRWVEGRAADARLSPTLFGRVGTFLGRLHQHSRAFVPPEGFVRRRWDWRWLLGEWTVLDPAFVQKKCDGLITSREQHILAAAAERIREEMQAIPQDSDSYGLVHFDFHKANYLFYKGAVHAIDFDDCCWNYYLFDMAITLSDALGRADEAAMRRAFFRGYQQVQPLPARYEEQLEVFTALRLIKRISYLFRSASPEIHAQAQSYLEQALPRLSSFADAKTSRR